MPAIAKEATAVRRALAAGFLLTLLALFSVFSIDGFVASRVAPSAARNRDAVEPFMNAVELLFAFPVSKFATGFALLLVGAVLLAFARWRSVARLFLYLGLTHLTARLIAGVLKNVFLRVRPLEALQNGGWNDRFFVDGGSSFPSGHAAHFWALFFAVYVAFPKLRLVTLILALAVATARVVVNDHYVSDVVASAAIAAFVAAAYARMIATKAPQSVATEG